MIPSTIPLNKVDLMEHHASVTVVSSHVTVVYEAWDIRPLVSLASLKGESMVKNADTLSD